MDDNHLISKFIYTVASQKECKTFWKFIIKYTSNGKQQNTISLNTWLEYFKQLLNPEIDVKETNDEFSNNVEYFLITLDCIKCQDCQLEDTLSKDFTEQEIINSKDNLKICWG